MLFKKYMKNHKIIYIYIYIYIFNKVEEKKLTKEELIPLLGFKKKKKKKIGVCIAFIVFMINLVNLEINNQLLSLS